MFPKNYVVHFADYEAHLQKVELTLIRCASLSLWTFLNSLVGRRKRRDSPPASQAFQILHVGGKKCMCPSATTFACEGKVNLQKQSAVENSNMMQLRLHMGTHKTKSLRVSKIESALGQAVAEDFLFFFGCKLSVLEFF